MAINVPMTALLLITITCSLCFVCVTGSIKGIYTFSRSPSFLEMRPKWPLYAKREFSFRFRTKLANGLLAHHSIVQIYNVTHLYDMSVKLEKGSIRVIHVYKYQIMSMTIGKGLSRDEWHSVRLLVDPLAEKISIWVNDLSENRSVPALKELSYGTMQSVLSFGALNPNDTLWGRQYGYEQFVGCLGDINLHVNGKIANELYSSSKYQVELGCINRCRLYDLCLHDGRCLNEYSGTTCDCFGSNHEGPVCGSNDISTITLRGYSYVSYKIYDWVDKVHSDFSRISISFRTNFDDSVLFYGVGEVPVRNYIAASLVNGSAHITIDFGDGPQTVTVGSQLNNDWLELTSPDFKKELPQAIIRGSAAIVFLCGSFLRWHNMTVLHHGKIVTVYLDNSKAENGTLEFVGGHHFHFDPRFYVGGVPIKMSKHGLKSVNNFVGSVREAYFDMKSILERLRYDRSDATYHGLFPPEYGFEEVTVLPVTFFYPESKIRLQTDMTNQLSLSLEFRTSVATGVLAHSGISANTGEGIGYWELRIDKGVAYLSIFVSLLRNSTFRIIKLGEDLQDGNWHYIKIVIANGQAEMIIDHGLRSIETLQGNSEFSTSVYIGGSTRQPQNGFIGCMKQIVLQDKYMDPRIVIDSDQIEGGEISMDNCQLVDPCKRPGVCEHGGTCIMEHKTVKCNCTGTGYTGKTCHFSQFKRTCEELFLLGYRESGVYMIDIDGNGPYPPAPVSCVIDAVNDVTSTTIETNVPPEMIVRDSKLTDFRIEVTYRNFTPAMLQTLIRHSKNCTQNIKYECFKVPLGLRSYTWFRSSYQGNYISSLGSNIMGLCKCGENRTCADPSKACNCDLADARWRFDEADLHDPELLGITEMFFLQTSNRPSDGQGRISLGSLKCIEMDTQQYVITFKTSDSFLEIPGWKSGDLSFSFRTSHEKAVLFFQPSIYPTYSQFQILLVNAHELVFEFSARGETKSVRVITQNPLNSGDWQQVWVDYDRHHVRFTINMDFRMIELEKDEEFGLFEGPLYVGGAPREHQKDSIIREGFVGCLRGLVINDEIANLYSYLSPRTPHVVTGCKPSCDPDPCKNGAECIEFWGSYECVCANTFAHSGTHCENNINENGVTFVTENGHFHKLYLENAAMPPALDADILANIRTYVSRGLLLYAHDHYNNFVQLHIANGNQLVFTYNSVRHLVQGTVTYDELAKGKPLQIFVDRQPNQTVLHVNDLKEVIPHPLKLVDKYRQNPWVAGQELELVKPPRPPVEPKPYLQLFLGALDKSNMEANIPGFVGCLRGLYFGSRKFDLSSLVDENPGTENFRKYCNMSCDSDPCENNGYCIEDWRNVQHQCECEITSYYGKSCERDIGSPFDGATLVKYSFVPDASTYQQVRVQLAFSTTHSPNQSSVLLFINSKVDERNYILIAFTKQGELRIEEDDGSRRGTVILGSVKANDTSKTFADGRRHWILYSRNMDNIFLKIDGIPVTTTIIPQNVNPSDIEINQTRYGGGNSDVVMVGGMEFIDSRFATYINYTGCISNAIVIVDSFTIYPLETAFTGGANSMVIGTLRQTKCAAFSKFVLAESSTKMMGNLTMFKDEAWNPKEPERLELKTVSHSNRLLEIEISEANTKRVGLVMGIFLLTIIIAIAIYLWRLDWKDKQYRYEEGISEETPSFKGRKALPLDGGIRAVSFQKNKNGVIFAEPNEYVPLNDFKDYSPYEDVKTSTDMDMPTDESDNDPEELSPKDVPASADGDVLTSSSEAETATDFLRRKTSSQELEWDPASETGDLFTAMYDYDPSSEDCKSMDDLMDTNDADNDFEPEVDAPPTVQHGPAPLAPLGTISEGEPESGDNLNLYKHPIKDETASPKIMEPKTVASIPPPISSGKERPPSSRTTRPVSMGHRPAPVFLPNNQRSFANPISYLGGPRFTDPPSKRSSTESVLSID